MSDNLNTYLPLSYDYASLYQTILAKLQTKSEWTNISENDTLLQLLLTILTTKEAGLFATINNTFTDFFPNVSSADELVYLFANYVKMPINPVASATCTETFSLTTSYSEDIELPAGIEVSSSDGTIIYTTQNSMVLSAGTLSIDVNVIQGQFKSVSNVSAGGAGQQYFLYVENDVNSLTVEVNNVVWTKVENFFFSVATDQVYMIVQIYNGLYILFNDGVFGAEPQSGDTVTINYTTSLGTGGNVFATGIITKLISPIYDINNVNVSSLISVTNDEVATNGYDGDTITTIQANFSAFFTTNPYITRKSDYKSYLLANPLVQDVNIYAGWELYPNDSTQWFMGFIYVVPKSGLILTPTEKTELFNYIKLKDIFFTNFQFNDVTYIGNYLSLALKFVDATVTQATINATEAQINTIITNYYNFQNAVTTYGTVFRDIYRSVIEKAILDNIPALLKCNIAIQSVETLSVVDSGQTLFTKFLSYTQVVLNETYLYNDLEQIGTFNSSWVLVPQDNSGSGGINWIGKISGSINIINYSITITILDPTIVNPLDTPNIVGNTLYVRSNSTDGNDIYAPQTGNIVYTLTGFTYTSLGL